MKPEDVPCDLLAVYEETLVGPFAIERCKRAALAAVLTAHETKLRAQVSAEILAAKGTDPRFPNGWASTQDRDHAAAIARGES